MEQRSDSKSKRSDSKSPKMQRGGSSEFAKKEENSALACHEMEGYACYAVLFLHTCFAWNPLRTRCATRRQRHGYKGLQERS